MTRSSLFVSRLTILAILITSSSRVLSGKIGRITWELFAAKSISSLAVYALIGCKNFFRGPDSAISSQDQALIPIINQNLNEVFVFI